MAYEQVYHDTLHHNLISNKKYYDFRAKYAKDIYWKYLPEKGTVIEFGCGIGQNIILEKDRAVGVDISEYARQESGMREITTFPTLEEAPQPQAIMTLHVLEHLENPAEKIQEFYQKLPEGGTLLIVLPNHSTNKPIQQQKMDVSQHLYGWHFGNINNLLIKKKFRIIKNEFNYARGYSIFYKLPYKLAKFMIYLAGRITNIKEMIIVAKK